MDNNTRADNRNVKFLSCQPVDRTPNTHAVQVGNYGTSIDHRAVRLADNQLHCFSTLNFLPSFRNLPDHDIAVACRDNTEAVVFQDLFGRFSLKM